MKTMMTLVLRFVKNVVVGDDSHDGLDIGELTLSVAALCLFGPVILLLRSMGMLLDM